MSATEKIVSYIDNASDAFTATEVASATEVNVAQVRPILRALVEQDRIEYTADRRKHSRGRPSKAFVKKSR